MGKLRGRLGQFNFPFGVSCSRGKVYVSDSNCIQEFDSNGTFLNKWGSLDAYELNNPQGMAADRQGNVYVADSDNHRILVYGTGSDITGAMDLLLFD